MDCASIRRVPLPDVLEMPCRSPLYSAKEPGVEYVDFRYRLGRQKNRGETFDEGAEETKGHSRQSAGYIPGARLLVAAS